MSDIKYRNKNKRGMVLKEQPALPSLNHNSHRSVRVFEPEIVEGYRPNDGFIQTLLNIYAQKIILKSRLNAQKEIYQKQAEALAGKLEVIRLQKAILKESLEMEWLRSGKYAQIIEQKYLGNGAELDHEVLEEALLELLEKINNGKEY